uniref:Distal membrane arm assembly complex 2-like protein n=1 Tax=Panagrolaimus sp. PS1159 TaxID=55785 RepID=A0AC35FR24_9BILA
LGADLAAAHFLVHRGAKVKFIGDDTWFKQDKKKRYKLPGVRVPGMYIEAIDASGTELLFEGFDNLYDLKHVRMLRLAGCKYIDDWTLGRIGSIFGDSLQMLDLSGCHRISAKGLRGLHSLKKLTYLRLEGLDHVENLAKSVLLLEETIPGLTVLGVNFEKSLENVEKQTKLLENDRVLIDAKGNCHAEDDNGRLFYINGCVNERATVDDEDRPIVQNTIRREIPAMPDEEFDKLDELSNGKLRHLLVGSPSNCHAEDDNGRLFYINGCVNERATVDDEDRPIVQNTIRREIPAMPDEEFDKLDELSNGKLRHLLVGSPSGYQWSDQVETILSFEYQKKLREKIPVEPKMFPAKLRSQVDEENLKLKEPEEKRKLESGTG